MLVVIMQHHYRKVLNGQEGLYLQAYIHIPNSRNGFLASLGCFELSLSNQGVWILPQETETEVVWEGGRFGKDGKLIVTLQWQRDHVGFTDQDSLFSAHTDGRAAPRHSKCQIVHGVSEFYEQNWE